MCTFADQHESPVGRRVFRCPRSGAPKTAQAPYQGVFDINLVVPDTQTMNVPSLYRRIGTTIKGRRQQLGLTQQQLATVLGISRASLANIETGRQRLLVHQLYRLADKLDLQPEDLLPKPEEMKELEILDDILFSENVTLEERRQIIQLLQQK